MPSFDQFIHSADQTIHDAVGSEGRRNAGQCWWQAARRELPFDHASDGFGAFAISQAQHPQPEQCCIRHTGEYPAVPLPASYLELVDGLEVAFVFPHMTVAF
jgi:hypothetical protein